MTGQCIWLQILLLWPSGFLLVVFLATRVLIPERTGRRPQDPDTMTKVTVLLRASKGEAGGGGGSEGSRDPWDAHGWAAVLFLTLPMTFSAINENLAKS